MNLHTMLRQREAESRPVRVGLIGAGKFGTMFLAQALRTPGLHLMGVADLDDARARRALSTTGWPDERITGSLADAHASGATAVTPSAAELIAADGVQVVIDATGDPAAGLAHVEACCTHQRHMVMVNVEADALIGPWLAARARQAGIVYSMAYGDQPALICEQVDWARACGFRVVAAGKGTKHRPHYHASTPDTVWGHYGLTPERAAAAGMNPKMFNSFLDGTKSAIEMTAVANATGLTAAPGGLEFPPCATADLARVLIPRADGGVLHHHGQVEVISSEADDARTIEDNLRWGVYVVIEAPSDYVAQCFRDYGLTAVDGDRHAALYRPCHLIGLELGISVASVSLRGEATGSANGFRADVVAIAKRDLAAGEVLDGEGGYTVWGRLMPAADSIAMGALPIGLAHGAASQRPVARGEVVRWRDATINEAAPLVVARRQMEAAFAPEGKVAA